MRKWLINTAVLIALAAGAMVLAKIADPWPDEPEAPEAGDPS